METIVNAAVKLLGGFVLLFLMSVGALFAMDGLDKQSLDGQRAWEFWNHYKNQDSEWKSFMASRASAADKGKFDEANIGSYENTALEAMKSKTRINFDFRGMSKMDRTLALMSLVFDKERPKLKAEKPIIYFPEGSKDIEFGKYFRSFDFPVVRESLPQTKYDVQFDSRTVQMNGKTLSILYSGVSGNVAFKGLSVEEQTKRLKSLIANHSFSLDYELVNESDASELKALIDASKKTEAEIAGFKSIWNDEKAKLRVVLPEVPLKISDPSKQIMIITRDDRHIYAKSVNDIAVEDLKSAKVIAVGGLENLKAMVKRLNESGNQAAVDLFNSTTKKCTPA